MLSCSGAVVFSSFMRSRAPSQVSQARAESTGAGRSARTSPASLGAFDHAGQAFAPGQLRLQQALAAGVAGQGHLGGEVAHQAAGLQLLAFVVGHHFGEHVADGGHGLGGRGGHHGLPGALQVLGVLLDDGHGNTSLLSKWL
jgi:hypothetical protein